MPKKHRKTRDISQISQPIADLLIARILDLFRLDTIFGALPSDVRTEIAARVERKRSEWRDEVPGFSRGITFLMFGYPDAPGEGSDCWAFYAIDRDLPADEICDRVTDAAVAKGLNVDIYPNAETDIAPVFRLRHASEVFDEDLGDMSAENVRTYRILKSLAQSVIPQIAPTLAKKPTPGDSTVRRMLKRLVAREVTASNVLKTKQSKGKSRMRGRAGALALLIEHPDWSGTRIAKELGVSRTTLYDWDEYKAARLALRNAARSAVPRGAKRRDGTIEAIHDR